MTATDPMSAPDPMTAPVSRSLADLAHDETGVLDAVQGERSFRRRLLEMGFLPGTPVRMVRNIPIGDVLEVELRSSRVSLRISEARAIRLREGASGDGSPGDGD